MHGLPLTFKHQLPFLHRLASTDALTGQRLFQPLINESSLLRAGQHGAPHGSPRTPTAHSPPHPPPPQFTGCATTADRGLSPATVGTAHTGGGSTNASRLGTGTNDVAEALYRNAYNRRVRHTSRRHTL